MTAPLTPMHQVGTEKSTTDTLHIISAILDVLLIFLIIGFGSNAQGKWFRFYSIGTILILLVSGTLVGLDNTRMGIWERINIVAFLTWVVVLAVVLLRIKQTSSVGEKSFI